MNETNETNESKEILKIEPNSRSMTLDNIKGIAMIFVILIHMRTQEYLGYSMLMVFFYAVPLYFFISGYLLSASVKKLGFLKYLKKRVIGILVPYIVFFVISFFWMNTVYSYYTNMNFWGFHTDWVDLLKAFFFAGDYLNSIAIIPPPIWFLHAMFFTSIIFYFLVIIKNKGIQIVLSLVLLFITVPLQQCLSESPYLLLRLLPVSLFFMMCGHFCKSIQIYIEKEDAEFSVKSPKNDNGLIFSFFAIPLFFAVLQLMQIGRGDIWGITSPWYFLGVLVFIVFCYLIAKQISHGVIEFIGRNSLLYLGIHPLVLVLPFIQELPEYFQERALDGMAAYIAYVLVSFLTISVLVYIAVLIKNYILSLLKRVQQ